MMHSPPTASSSTQYSDHCTIIPMNLWPVHDETFAFRFLRGEQMAACKQVAYMPWWLTILVTRICAESYGIRFSIALKNWLLTVVWALQNISIDYQKWKIKHRYRPRSLTDRALPKTQSHSASSLVQLTI